MIPLLSAQKALPPQYGILLLRVNHPLFLGYAKMAVTVTPTAVPVNKVVELVRLYVAEGETGHGVGGALFSAVTSKAKAAGFTGCWLRVWEKNESAIRFYERDGFQQLGREPYLIGQTANPVLLMFHELL